MELDELDIRILSLLYKNSRLKNTEIASILGVSEGRIRHRIRRLLKKEIIGRFTIEYGPGTAHLSAYVEIQLRAVASKEFLKELVKRKSIVEINEIAGETDFLVRIDAPSPAALNREIDAIQRIDGIEKTRTMIVLNRHLKPLELEPTVENSDVLSKSNAQED